MEYLLGIKNKTNRTWSQIIGWWEIRRIPYNLILLLAGFFSLQIAYVSIPLIYIIIGLGLNVLYCFGWIIDIHLVNSDNVMQLNVNHSKRLFLIYLAFSLVVIIGVAVLILVS